MYKFNQNQSNLKPDFLKKSPASSKKAAILSVPLIDSVVCISLDVEIYGAHRVD